MSNHRQASTNREAAMLMQGGLVWLGLAGGGFIVWLACAAIVYLALPENISPVYRFSGAASSAAILVFGLIRYILKMPA